MKATHVGTAGATLDFPEAPGLFSSGSSLSKILFSFDIIRREVIVKMVDGDIFQK